MIYAPRRKLVFVHIPKTGGTSMALALEARAQAEDILIGDTPKAQRRRKRLKQIDPGKRLWKHSSYRDLAEVIGAETLSDCLVFTLVRNPWVRVLSYYHWLRSQNWEHPAVAAAKAKAFKDFLFDPFVTKSFEMFPYTHYVHGASTPHFVRLEHLWEDMAPIEAHLGFEINLPQANRSNRPDDWRAAYDSASKDQVGRLCAEDIARFGYTF